MGAVVCPQDIATLDGDLSAPLTVQDRCDRCAAQAYVRVATVGNGFEILFCAHHFDKFAVVLADCATIVTDDRSALRSKES